MGELGDESGGPRTSVLATGGMVASAHPAASFVGAKVLEEGGSAIDAALAMAAMTAVVLPAQCGVGGDAFALVLEPTDRSVRAYHGSGVGPDGADLGFFAERGLDAIPVDGPLSVTVPGMVSCAAALHRAGATRSLAELWEPAARAGELGVVVTPKNAEDLRTHRALLARDGAAAAVYLPGGRPPRAGERLVQRDLAASLRRIAREPADFYTGELAERCLAALRDGGAPFSGEEWAAQEARVLPALAGRYRGRTLHTTHLPSPGYMVLEQAAVLDGLLDGLDWLDPRAIELLARAAIDAFAERAARVGSDTEAWRALLDKDAIAAARARLAAPFSPPVAAPGAGGDTTSFVVADGAGRVVSYIHSLAFTFGARVMVPGTGILLNDRLGRGAYLAAGHPNALAPRRRPMHTLCAWIVTDDGGNPLAVGNTPGGDGQVQWNMQLLSHLLDHRASPQQAASAPRFTVVPGSDANALGVPLRVECESRIGASRLAALGRAGLPISEVGPWAAGGGAQLIAADPKTGTLAGGSDPRQEGCALGVL